MNYLLKFGTASLGFATIGGASYVGYINFSKDNIVNKLGVSVLDLNGNVNSKEWTSRLKELKEKESNLNDDLKKIANQKWKNLQNWCKEKADNKFINKEDNTFKIFEEFCTWKIGDKNWTNKILSSINDQSENWKTAHTALKTKQKENLSSSLQALYDIGADQEKKAMHDWCNSVYKNTWTGEKDTNFKEAQEYCKA